MHFLPFLTKDFYPLTLTMDLENVLFGAMSLGDRWRRIGKQHIFDHQIWVEPTVMPDPTLVDAFYALLPGQALVQEDLLVAICLRESDNILDFAYPIQNWKLSYEIVEWSAPLDRITSLQYLIDHNADQIRRDGETGTPDHRDLTKNVIIDEQQGPVIVDKKATILPGARIMGPVAILSGAVVKMGAEIYPGSTIGSYVVANGEIKNAIIHEYSAKGHAGFLGDSIIGRWNNFGAGTTTSNVSNTFSNVRFEDWNTGEEVVTEVLKRGLVTGDFVKLGIMTKTYRATAIGPFSSIATLDAIQGNIPPMTWWTDSDKTRYNPDQLRTHCRRQMALKGIVWDEIWESGLQNLLRDNNNPKNGFGK